MKNFIGKNVNKLLYLLTLAFLVTAMIRLWVNRPPAKINPPAITITWWEDDPAMEGLEYLIDEFKNQHSRINIILETVPYEELLHRLFTPDEVSLGDVIALDSLWVSELLEGEIIENVSDSFMNFANVFYYNVHILREAGFSRPPKSRSELLSYAKILTMGMDGSRGIFDDILPWIWSAGAELIVDGKPALTSKAVVDSLSFISTLNKEGLISPGAFSKGSGDKIDDFISGRAAFMIGPSSEIKKVGEHLGYEAFAVTSIPAPDNYFGKSFFGTAGRTIGVYSGSVHKEEARLFADFLAGNAAFLSDKANALSENGNPPAGDPLYLKVWDIAIAGEPARDFFGLPWIKLEKVFKQELSAMFEEKLSPEETAVSIQKKWADIIN